ncbi:hypothetical protein CIB84_013911 [Bambusicola thoracicus]|uniref:Uncharacterized protein n=1 Tax=Bambusicola thoracicus TaxID=9083 RepID=A0A2P4SE03_BAMTH|nr:hypothetical protein CIB84_013911 [Bambusicola thoracicus]
MELFSKKHRADFTHAPPGLPRRRKLAGNKRATKALAVPEKGDTQQP